MSDEMWNRVLDNVSGFLFGLGVGMIMGVYWLCSHRL